MARKHFSREWDDAPMPHSIFFTRIGHAIHGTTYTGKLVNFKNGAPTEVDGSLTLHGVTKPVNLKINSFLCKPNPRSQQEVCGADATGTFNRDEYGITLGQDPDLLQYVVDHRIPLEICPTSNVQTHVVRNYETHPLRQFVTEGVPVTTHGYQDASLRTVDTRAPSADRLRGLLREPGLHLAPACYDALSARMVERAGFRLSFMSGFAVAAARLGRSLVREVSRRTPDRAR